MEIKRLGYDYLDKIMQLEEASWPEGTRGSRENFESRIKTFPEGVIGALYDNELVALSTSMIINGGPINSWEGVTSNGSIKTHNPEGDSLYIVSIGVHPSYRGRDLAQTLINEQIALGKDLGLKQAVLGSRVPGFNKYIDSIEKYAPKTL